MSNFAQRAREDANKRRLDEITTFMEPHWMKTVGYTKCKKKLCLRAVQNIIKDFGLPDSPSKLRDLQRQIGTQDLQNRCMICYYRGYRDEFFK